MNKKNDNPNHQLSVRTGLRVGKPAPPNENKPDVDLLDRALFGLLDALQTPTNVLYDWVCRPKPKGAK